MDIRRILQEMIDRGASDLHLKVGSSPTLRIDGELLHMELEAPSPKQMEAMAGQILTEEQAAAFSEEGEVDFAFGLQGLARFRANIYKQRNTVAIAVRNVPLEIPQFENLTLPDVLQGFVKRQRGLLLVTGTVGSGKSTTLAAMIDVINRTMQKNIITIEDPVEFLHRDSLSMVSQREIGLDTGTYAQGLRYILRQDPDVILLGEIRDMETMRVALMAADTGHLVMSTLHTTNAAQTINRVLTFYPPHQHGEIRFLMASTLAGIVSQRLVPRADGQGRVPAVEVLIATDAVREMILDPEKTLLLPQAIVEGHATYGMQSFDQSLMDLYSKNLVTLEAALRYASNPTEFQLRVEGIHATSDTSWGRFEEEKEQAEADSSKDEWEDIANRVGDGRDEPEGIDRF